MEKIFSGLSSKIVLIIIVLLICLLIVFSPEEKTLGAGIKIVYLHVAVTWASLIGFGLAGLIGLILGITAADKQAGWLKSLYRVSLVYWVISILLSMWASQVNWGGIPLGEPRYIATFNLLAVAVIVVVLNSWLKGLRWPYFLSILPIAYFLYAVYGAHMPLHPENPIGTSESAAIQFAFFGMFGLMMLLGTWLVIWYKQLLLDE